MQTVTRRDFLGATALTGIGVLTADGAWALNKLEPLTDTLDQDYPYRAWEDLYRDEFTWDHVGYAAHCINCVGNCAFRIYVKDGIVLREEQLAEYPQINPDTPDANPAWLPEGRHPLRRDVRGRPAALPDEARGDARRRQVAAHLVGPGDDRDRRQDHRHLRKIRPRQADDPHRAAAT